MAKIVDSLPERTLPGAPAVGDVAKVCWRRTMSALRGLLWNAYPVGARRVIVKIRGPRPSTV